MGTMMGFLLGYYLGVKAGPKGHEGLQEAWQTITSSEELKDLLTGGFAVARDMARKGGAIVAARLAEQESSLRRAA